MQPQVQAAPLTRDLLSTSELCPRKSATSFCYRRLFRPIAWTVSLDLEGRLNAAQYSRHQAVRCEPRF
jgi:hypothetical protein